MRYYCRECGHEIEPGADFCYYCGALKSKAIAIDDEGREVSPAYSPDGVCPDCGHKNVEGASFCSECGRRLSSERPQEGAAMADPFAQPYGPYPVKTLTRKDYLAMFLAFVPGIVNIFGLGHLVMGKWSRAFMYLMISAVVLYLRFTVVASSGTGVYMLYWFITFAVYFQQSMEVVRLVYAPPGGGKQDGPGGDSGTGGQR